jgi:hypothetical protein
VRFGGRFVVARRDAATLHDSAEEPSPLSGKNGHQLADNPAEPVEKDPERTSGPINLRHCSARRRVAKC